MHAPDADSRVSRWLHPVALVAVTLAAYASATANGFVWDDQHLIVQTSCLESLSNLPRLFMHDAMWCSDGGKFAAIATVDTYRPLTIATFGIERAVFGLWAAAFHVTSVLIHAANVLLLSAVGRRLGASPLAATAGAALFAVHPSHAEAVHWINGRSDPLAVFFVLAATIVWLRGADARRGGVRDWPYAAAAGALVILGTLCKETTFLLVPPLLFVALARGLRGGELVRAMAPLAAALGVGVAMRLAALGDPAVAAGSTHVGYALMRVPIIWRDAVVSFVVPEQTMRPSLVQHYAEVGAGDLALSILLVLGLVAAAGWAWWRGQRAWAWAVVTFLLVLAPIGLLTYSEGWSGWGRYLYPAFALPCLLVGMAYVDGALPRLRASTRRLALGGGAVLLVALALLTSVAGLAWRDERSFAMAQIADAPTSSVGYAALALAEHKAGNLDLALAAIDEALRIAPSEPRHLARRALILLLLGRHGEALRDARAARTTDPGNSVARYVMAYALLHQNQQTAAAEVLVPLLAERPDSADVRALMQDALRSLGPTSEFARAVETLVADPRYRVVADELGALR